MQTQNQIARSADPPPPPDHDAAQRDARSSTVSTIVVTYNNERQISDCLSSLCADPATAAGIIVVDNASTDGTAEIVAESFPSVHVIRSPENLGFGRACNLAAEQATGEYLAFVNPDTVLRGDAITQLLLFARTRPDGGIYGGRTIRPDGTAGIESCWAQPSLWGNLCFGTGLSTALPRSIFDPEALGRWNRDSEREVGVVTGLLMLISRELWRTLRGFDDDFFMYSEDVDLSMRAMRFGYRPSITPNAIVVHEGGGSSASTGAQRVLLLAGRVTFMRKQWTLVRRTAGIGLLALGVGLRAAGGNDGWRHAWTHRARWIRGYPSASEMAPAAVAPGGRAPAARVVEALVARSRSTLIRAVRKPLYYGDKVTCPCCGGDYRRLITHRGVPNVRCPGCGSMERHRLLWLYLQQRTDLHTRRYRVLHMAPEISLQRLLRRLPNIDYVSADLASPLAEVHCDIQELPFVPGRFDVVICNHVLEHIPDDRRAMSELVRVMAPGGWAVLMCPIARDRATTLTDPAVNSPDDALRVYGQEDHVRLYGADYRDRLEAAGLTVSIDRFLDDLAPEVIHRYALRRKDDLFDEDDIYIGRVD